MKYVAPAIIFLIALPLVILAAVFFMRRKQVVASPPQLGNAPQYTNVPGTVAAIGGQVAATATAAADTAKSLKSILGQFVADDSDYTPEPSLPASTPFYQWGTGDNIQAEHSLPYMWN